MNLFLLVAATAFYGVTFDPVTTNAPSASRIVPVNFVRYRMIQPDGVVRNLHRDPDRPGVILGDPPWVGMIEKNVISVWADPEATGGRQRTAFTFVNGQLRNLFLDGTNYRFPSGSVKLDGALESLWPEKKKRTYEKGSAADIWRNDTRLKLWFANPNSAGMFCAQVALIGFWLLLAGRWYRRVPGLFLFAMSLYGVAQSGSRSALLALVMGSVLSSAVHLRRHFSVKTLAVVVVLAGMVCVAVSTSGLSRRFTDTVRHVDPGNQRRIKIGKAAVRMFADAPLGWRCGEVPGRNAALNWYVFDDNHVIRTHLLSLAELGWPVGFGYVFFWLVAIAWGFAMSRRSVACSLGEWTAFAAAGMFNPVYTEFSLWVVPAAATACDVWATRKALTRKALVVSCIVAAGLALILIVALVAVGHAMNVGRPTSVRAVGRCAAVNGSAPSVWIVEDKPVMGGWGFPGREVLAYYAKHPDAPAIGYASEVGDLPHEVDRLVLPGRSAAEYLDAYRQNPESVCQARQILFLSPSVMPDRMDSNLLGKSEIVWQTGAFAVWREKGCGKFPKWVKVLPGIEQYVPNWMGKIVGGK